MDIRYSTSRYRSRDGVNTIMKLAPLLEAKVATKKHDLDQLAQQLGIPDRPKLQREHDFVWHLYKFWESTGHYWLTRRNPKYTKAAREMINSIVERQMKSKDSVYWKDIDPKILYTEMLGKQDGSWWTVVDKLDDALSEEYPTFYNLPDAEYERNRKSKDQILNKVKNTFDQELANLEDQLPAKHFPTGAQTIYQPKQGYVAMWKDDHKLTRLDVRHDKNGVVTKVYASPNQDYSGNHWDVSAIATKRTPGELKDTLHYYQKHEHGNW